MLYEENLNAKTPLAFEDAIRIYETICGQLDLHDEDVADLWGDFLKACMEYSQIRAQWSVSTVAQRAEMDNRRTAAHNAVIARTNALSRALGVLGKDVSWREELGPEETHRKKIGDFACYVVLFRGLSAR